MSCCSEPESEDKKTHISETAASCCSSQKNETVSTSCCDAGTTSKKQRFDWLLWGSASVIVLSYFIYFLGDHETQNAADSPNQLHIYTSTTFSLMNQMWWGILMGIIVSGILSHIPREFVIATLGRGGNFTGLLRATLAGLMLDLCNHGILMVGMQLYRRGASLGQTMAFLIASPWNSLSLTIILVALIGWKWTLIFILLSAIIALTSGMLFEIAVKRKLLPANQNTIELPEDFHFLAEARKSFSQWRPSATNIVRILKDGLIESRMILRWIFFGIVLVGLIRVLIPETFYQAWFGPSIMGLGLTLLATTVLEVCSEGSSPIAADLVNRANAPGNGFTFLMAGAATDYTEIMALKETTHSWKISLALPLITVPQILLVGYLLN